MDILAALRLEETRLERQAETTRQQLETVRAAMKLLGRSGVGGAKSGRKMSAAAKAKISKAAKLRWAKIKAAKNKS